MQSDPHPLKLLKKVLASYTFRFLVLYVVGLSVSVLVILALVYTGLSYGYFKELGASVDGELDTLERVYRNGGATAVDYFVKQKLRPGEINRYYYLLVDENYRKLAGNLDTWPRYRQLGQGWLRFQMDIFHWDGKAIDTIFVARTKDLKNGYHLLVARHFDDIVDGANLVATALIRSMIVTIVLGTIGGALVGTNSVRQLDVINRTLQRIMSGDLSERINPDIQRGEIWDLANNINQMLDRIQALMQGMRQVSDNIAHDLRTPLTRLRNHLTDLQEQLAETQNEETVQVLIKEADAILSTFNALLRIARIESGSRRAAFAPLDLKVILLDVVELYEPLAMDKSINMRWTIAEGAALEGDRDLLFQAMANLIDNAIKYTPEGGSIDIRLALADGRAVISVADTGCGIPAEDKSKVFRRFYRVESSRSQQPGNGLGLSLVWAVTKLHGGDITLADNHPGLRVEIALPLGK